MQLGPRLDENVPLAKLVDDRVGGRKDAIGYAPGIPDNGGFPSPLGAGESHRLGSGCHGSLCRRCIAAEVGGNHQGHAYPLPGPVEGHVGQGLPPDVDDDAPGVRACCRCCAGCFATFVTVAGGAF